jgi:hypothetical protein
MSRQADAFLMEPTVSVKEGSSENFGLGCKEFSALNTNIKEWINSTLDSACEAFLRSPSPHQLLMTSHACLMGLPR